MPADVEPPEAESWPQPTDVERVLREQTGAVGRRYLAALGSESRHENWIVDAVWRGEHHDRVMYERIDDDLHLALVLAALEAVEDDADYWLIGDGPCDEGLAPRPGMCERFRALRATNPRVDRLFEVMVAYNIEMDFPRSWWAD